MWELLLRSTKFKIGTIVAFIIIMLGLFGPFFTRDPNEVDFWRGGQPPSWNFLLGTTTFGEDIFAQLCTGIRNSLMVGALAGLIGTGIAVLVGGVCTYAGGIWDKIGNFATNITIVFPVLPILIIIASIIEQRSLWLVGLLIALFGWPWAARSIRSQVLTLKEREFVNLSKMSGQDPVQIVVTEVLPNMLAYIVMVFVLLSGGAILAESGLSMIGVGPAGTITLGQMLYWAMNQSTQPFWWGLWWWFIPPGLVLTIFLSAVFVMHAGMDEVFNPRLRGI
jgi:peptide/nickel transport system permease protein